LSRKVAAWMAGELGLAKVAAQRGWEALKAVGWSIQKPRPKNPKAASPAEEEAFKKTRPAELAVARVLRYGSAVLQETRDGQDLGAAAARPGAGAGSGASALPGV